MTEQYGLRAELFIVDDDPSVRDALSAVFTYEGYRVTGFEDGAAFLTALQSRAPSCVLLDVHMPGRSGIDILKELDGRRCDAPIFVISAQGDIPLAVDAIKNGAFDFIEKPFDLDFIAVRVRSAIDAWGLPTANGRRGGQYIKYQGHDLLTPREREVLTQIANGSSNKEAGRQLRISPRTVEVHRARIMDKLGARNAADLVRIVLTVTGGD